MAQITATVKSHRDRHRTVDEAMVRRFVARPSGSVRPLWVVTVWNLAMSSAGDGGECSRRSSTESLSVIVIVAKAKLKAKRAFVLRSMQARH